MTESAAWSGSLSAPSLLADEFVAGVTALANAAKHGDWRAMFRLLDDLDVGPNVWRPGGTTGFTPLHQAAWHGAVDVAHQLLRRGAWRSLPTLDGRTAADVARDRGQDELVRLLEPKMPYEEPSNMADIDDRLHDVVMERARDCGVREPLRPFPTVVLQEIPPGQQVWFAIPGMYGGFAIELRRRVVLADSWSRVVGGSGTTHVIAPGLTVVVDRGFV